MNISKTSVRVLLCALFLGALAASPAIVAAWTESTLGARQASPIGCIQQSSGLLHDGADLTIEATAVTAGFGVSPGQPKLCTQITTPGIAKLIGGIMTGTLIKLNSAGAGSNPDNYSICRVVSTGVRPLGSSLRLNTKLTAPCGNGWYAQIICVQNATTRITDGVVALDGTFNATNPVTHCNVSEAWHPIGLPGAPIKGTAVKL